MLTPPLVPTSVFYEMALLQFTPDATSEERINIGVVALDTAHQRFYFKITDRYGRLREIYPDLDGQAFRNIVRGIRTRCTEVATEVDSDRLGLWRERSLEHLVNRIVLPGSANFMWGAFRYGACDDLDARVAEVFTEYVDRGSPGQRRHRMTPEQIWAEVINAPELNTLRQYVENPLELTTSNLTVEFRGSWMNGSVQVAHPISLDLQDPDDIVGRAAMWSGYTSELRRDHTFQLTAIVNDRPDDSRQATHDQAVELLRANDAIREVVTPSTADRLATAIQFDLRQG